MIPKASAKIRPRRPREDARTRGEDVRRGLPGADDDPAVHFETTLTSTIRNGLVRDIPFYSMCEHHLALPLRQGAHRLHPVEGRSHLRAVEAGTPGGRLRETTCVQERLDSQVADTLIVAAPAGSYRRAEVEHLCDEHALCGRKPGSEDNLRARFAVSLPRSQTTRAPKRCRSFFGQ